MTADREQPSAWHRVYAKVDEIFGADLRSLAAFRIVLAVIVLIDLVGRSANLRVHYTDEGVLPRRVLLPELDRWQISANLLNGTLFVQALLFGVTALAAVALLAGYRTRAASVVVWFMILSIQWRNPFVLSAGDTLLRLLLFWAMFLPLGACWSIDRTRAGRERVGGRVLSAATAAVFLQIAFVYWFTAILKSGQEWRSDGTALYYALSAEHLTTSVGTYLTQFPSLLKTLTFATFGLEALGPFLLFFPFFTARLRTWTVAAFMGLHAGIFLTMELGLFPLLSAFCMVCFLPTRFWDGTVPKLQTAFAKAARRLPRASPATARPELAFWTPIRTWLHSLFSIGQPATAGIAIHPSADGADRPGGHTARDETLPAVPAPPWPVEPARIRSSPLTNIVVLGFLLFAFGRNVTSVSDFTMPEPVRPIGYLAGLNQRWNMFAPRPSTSTHWYVIPGTLSDGREIDLTTAVVHDGPALAKAVSWERPENMRDAFGDKYWRKYLDDMKDDADQRRYFAAYICRTWNADHQGPSELVSLEIVYVSEKTRPDQGLGEPKRDVVVTRTCD